MQFIFSGPEAGLLASFFTAVGWLLGHRLAVGRDRRQEFNCMTNPIYSAAMNQIGRSSKHIEIECDQWHIVEIYIPVCQRWLFRRRLRDYNQSYENLCKYDPDSGVVTFDEAIVESHRKAAKRLLKYLKPR